MSQTKKLAALNTALIKIESLQSGVDKLIKGNQNEIQELLNLIK
jgi:hypothetical protein